MGEALYRIRPLEWREYINGYDNSTSSAQQPFGHVIITLKENRFHLWAITLAGEYTDPNHYVLLKDAKEAAEQWYREQLLSALEPISTEGKG